MIEKTLTAVVADGVRALEHQAEGLKADLNRGMDTLGRYKRLAAELVKLSDEVRDGDYFSKVQVLKIGEVSIIGDRTPANLGLQIGYGGGYAQLSGTPSPDEFIPNGRYRIVVTMQKIGEL